MIAADASAVRLLLVDDEASIREPLAAFLEREQFAVDAAPGAAEARQYLAEGRYDLALLDIMMPGEDGLSLARYILQTLGLPVILLTAKTEEIDRIIGLELGADDYVPKPFSPRELVARIRAVLRRGVREGPKDDAGAAEAYIFDELRLDLQTRTLLGRGGEDIPVTGGEYRLLKALVERAPRVVSRDDLLELTQNRRADIFDRSVDNQISRLRKKVEREAGTPKLIKTVRGGGYALAAPVLSR